MDNKATRQKIEIIIVVLLIGLLFYFFAYPSLRLSYYEKKAAPAIVAIDKFKKMHGRYPSSLSEAGVNDGHWIEYEQTADSYRLAFYAGVYWYTNTYDPETSEWFIQD